MIHINEVGEA